MNQSSKRLQDVLDHWGLYLRVCSCCGKQEPEKGQYKQCSQCKGRAYCDKDCQAKVGSELPEVWATFISLLQFAICHS